MVLKELSEQIGKATIINFAAVLALLIYTVMVSVHIVIAVQAEAPMEAFKDVILWAMPILLNILATYGIMSKKEG